MSTLAYMCVDPVFSPYSIAPGMGPDARAPEQSALWMIVSVVLAWIVIKRWSGRRLARVGT